MSLCCEKDERRDAVRRKVGWNGLDYLEVSDDQRTLYAYFLGKLPPELSQKKPGLERYLQIEGGQQIRDIQIIDVDPVVDPNPEKDDYLVIKLDRPGDFANYTLRLVKVEKIDPRYDHAVFSFKINCPSDLDCAPARECEPRIFDQPEINYLAKDYASFRQLILDRLALLIPEWKERHAPDLGIMLVELLAYTGDYLSYYQDAVATEAYLETARRRISVRRHARLVDYLLHEGCNARAWVCVEIGVDQELDPAEMAFVTGYNDALEVKQTVLKWEWLSEIPAESYEVFEPVDRARKIELRAAHNEIHFHTWGEKECCLERGSTSAALLDSWVTADTQQQQQKQGQQKKRALDLKPGDVLIFEELIGPKTGLRADADPARRHAVRLTSVTPGEDPVTMTKDSRPTPYLIIEWAPDDALPFTFCLSTIGPAPDCDYLDHVSVARGNVILVDHGKTETPEALEPAVPTLRADTVCDCVDHPGEVQRLPGLFRPRLKKTPLTFRQPPNAKTPAALSLRQDVRLALPQVTLASTPAEPWEARNDLIASRPNDRHFVVEIDNEGAANLRFGDRELGYQPTAGMTFTATYRVGNGVRGNVGAEAISRLVLNQTTLSGVSVVVRNPLPAVGGTDSEPMAEAKLYAPHHFRKRIERAIIAADYQQIAERNAKIQRAAGALVWTGSWYDAELAIDPFGRQVLDDEVRATLTADLELYRRMGHGLHVTPALYVPLDLKLEVCASPQYERAKVKAALLNVFSARNLPGGKRGFFHPDNLVFSEGGEGIYLSRIIAEAQAVAGVESVRIERCHRLFEAPNQEIENGLLPLRNNEIARLDNDPNFPERGKLEIVVNGGR